MYNQSGTVGTYSNFSTLFLNANGTTPKSMLACYQILTATAQQRAAFAWSISTSYQAAHRNVQGGLSGTTEDLR